MTASTAFAVEDAVSIAAATLPELADADGALVVVAAIAASMMTPVSGESAAVLALAGVGVVVVVPGVAVLERALDWVAAGAPVIDTTPRVVVGETAFDAPAVTGIWAVTPLGVPTTDVAFTLVAPTAGTADTPPGVVDASSADAASVAAAAAAVVAPGIALASTPFAVVVETAGVTMGVPSDVPAERAVVADAAGGPVAETTPGVAADARLELTVDANVAGAVTAPGSAVDAVAFADILDTAGVVLAVPGVAAGDGADAVSAAFTAVAVNGLAVNGEIAEVAADPTALVTDTAPGVEVALRLFVVEEATVGVATASGVESASKPHTMMGFSVWDAA